MKKGKKRKLAGGLIIIFSLLMTSCEKDKALSEAILGKWEVISLTRITFENNVKRTESTIYYDADEIKFQFIDGGTGILYDNGNDYLFSWTLTGSQLLISKLFDEDLVTDITIENSNLICTFRENDELQGLSYDEIILTAKRIK